MKPGTLLKMIYEDNIVPLEGVDSIGTVDPKDNVIFLRFHNSSNIKRVKYDVSDTTQVLYVLTHHGAGLLWSWKTRLAT